MTSDSQIRIGLMVCQAVLEALVRTHPNKERLHDELTERFRELEANMLADESIGAQEQAQMNAAIQAFQWALDH